MGSNERGRRLSVARELVHVAASLEALRLVAQQKLNGSCHAEKAHELAAIIAGGLHVLGDRIHLLEGILLNAVNPALILSPENEASSSESGPGIIREWSPEEEEARLSARWRSFYRRNLAQREPLKKPNPDRSN